jgi:hypothetical protein
MKVNEFISEPRSLNNTFPGDTIAFTCTDVRQGTLYPRADFLDIYAARVARNVRHITVESTYEFLFAGTVVSRVGFEKQLSRGWLCMLITHMPALQSEWWARNGVKLNSYMFIDELTSFITVIAPCQTR